MNERGRALALLRRISTESLYASLVLHDESGFVRTLVLGVLRWRSRLDFEISRFARKKVDAEVMDILRIGVYQLRFMDVAPYAAVAETVNFAPKYARGFVNAILRRVGDAAPAEPQDIATRTAHPEWLVGRWARLFGEERAAAIAAANQELSQPDVLALGDAPADSEPSPLADGMYRLRGSTAELDRARFWPMDEGSAVIAAMAANSGGSVLDVAAAPGGKSLYLKWRGANVVSNDISITRLLPLLPRSRRVVVSDGRRMPFRREFDTVLLDAPCSATGTIRKNPEIKWRLREDDLRPFAALQKQLLESALDAARERCIYSTCSLEPEENDEVVSGAEARGFEIVDAAAFVPPACVKWVSDGVLRLTPESGADGFTAFVLRRKN